MVHGCMGVGGLDTDLTFVHICTKWLLSESYHLMKSFKQEDCLWIFCVDPQSFVGKAPRVFLTFLPKTSSSNTLKPLPKSRTLGLMPLLCLPHEFEAQRLAQHRIHQNILIHWLYMFLAHNSCLQVPQWIYNFLLMHHIWEAQNLSKWHSLIIVQMKEITSVCLLRFLLGSIAGASPPIIEIDLAKYLPSLYFQLIHHP